MKGQWIGKYNGDLSGKIMINIDKVEDRYECVAYLIPDDHGFPGTIAYFGTHESVANETVRAYVAPIDPRTGFQDEWDKIQHLFRDGVVHSKAADVRIELKGEKLYLDAVSDIGVKVTSQISKPIDAIKSKIAGEQVSWQDFKSKIQDFSKSKYIFRGQKEPWRLRTAFHRRGRYRISEFATRDVKQLHKKLTAITKHYFDLSVPDQNGAFFNLVQHHGYPTPLLDWTYSPYVAAFFAFRDWLSNSNKDGYARIYCFNQAAWVKRYPQSQNLDPAFPHLSVMEFIAINNPRLVPQQSVTTVTNLDDIEAYILDREAETRTKYLQAFDIPASDRSEAMQDLRFMGITAGSMFPGIDGVCEELREINFEDLA